MRGGKFYFSSLRILFRCSKRAAHYYIFQLFFSMPMKNIQHLMTWF